MKLNGFVFAIACLITLGCDLEAVLGNSISDEEWKAMISSKGVKESDFLDLSKHQYTAKFDDDMIAAPDSSSNFLRRDLGKNSCQKSGCKAENIGDGICNPECHSKVCKNDGGDCDGYDITVANFGNDVPTPMQEAISSSIRRWKSTVSDIPGGIKIPKDFDCAGVKIEQEIIIDDMLVLFGIITIDGVNGTLAQAGLCGGITIKGKFYPALYIIVFDVADYPALESEGHLESVMLHEIGHAIGIGSLWDQFKLLAGSSPLVYKGKGGIKGLQMIGGSGKPIVEEEGGDGTARGHWDEETYGDELMTGYLKNVKGKLSKMTIQSIVDLGYKVSLDSADPYTIPNKLRTEDKDEHKIKLKGCIKYTKNPPQELEWIPPQ